MNSFSPIPPPSLHLFHPAFEESHLLLTLLNSSLQHFYLVSEFLQFLPSHWLVHNALWLQLEQELSLDHLVPLKFPDAQCHCLSLQQHFEIVPFSKQLEHFFKAIGFETVGQLILAELILHRLLTTINIEDYLLIVEGEVKDEIG